MGLKWSQVDPKTDFTKSLQSDIKKLKQKEIQLNEQAFKVLHEVVATLKMGHIYLEKVNPFINIPLYFTTS